MNLDDGGNFENLEIRINSDYIIKRNKIKFNKNNKNLNILKGKYDIIENYDSNFKEKFKYEDFELLISPASSFRLKEKINVIENKNENNENKNINNNND